MSYKLSTFLNADWQWYLTHPWEFLIDFYKEAKVFLQRGWRGYADADVWSFDEYLKQVLAGGLKELSKQEATYPGIGTMDTFKKWQKALKTNAKRFQDALEYEGEDQYKLKKYKKIHKEQDKALMFVRKWFDYLWW